MPLPDASIGEDIDEAELADLADGIEEILAVDTDVIDLPPRLRSFLLDVLERIQIRQDEL